MRVRGEKVCVMFMYMRKRLRMITYLAVLSSG